MSDKCALAFGEVLWDVYPEKKLRAAQHSTLRRTLRLKGGSARLISAVGDDTLGQQALCEIQKAFRGYPLCFRTARSENRALRCNPLDGNAVPKYDLIPDTADRPHTR